MTDLANATIDEIYAELRKRKCAAIIVQAETLDDVALHPYDVEESAWRIIDEIIETQKERFEEEDETNDA